jgi:hypothetical protein
MEGPNITFNVQSGKEEIKSSAWSGNGLKDFDPLPTKSELKGEKINNDVINVEIYGSTIKLTKGTKMLAQPGLIFPDYIFG